jgi:hypothetical protein
MSKYQIIAKKTNELSKKEWTEFTSAFNSVFKQHFSPDYFKTKYYGSSFGYSVHGILFHDNKIVGMFTAIPRQYIFKEQEITIDLGCDAFILKEHRKDEYFLKQMADEVTTKLKNASIYHFISIPNETAYPYWKFYGGWKDIGKLNYYIVPLRVSRLLGKYNLLDSLSFFAFRTIITCSAFVFPFSKKYRNKIIHLKRDQKYFAQRFNSDYTIRQISDKGSFVYRFYKENNIRTIYLIDCFPLSQANITIALKQIIKETKGNLDIILFVGKIDNPPFFFLKVPEKSEPRVQPFIGLSFNSTSDNDFFSIDSWEVSLANFDNR